MDSISRIQTRSLIASMHIFDIPLYAQESEESVARRVQVHAAIHAKLETLRANSVAAKTLCRIIRCLIDEYPQIRKLICLPEIQSTTPFERVFSTHCGNKLRLLESGIEDVYGVVDTMVN